MEKLPPAGKSLTISIQHNSSSKRILLFLSVLCLAIDPLLAWIADNGNGTFTNPLFYDEFSDPDLIRVGDDYYMTGTTMHSMPGLPVLHSKDLVNWELSSYAFEKLDLGPRFRLEDGKDIYGRGIWAPCFRYHDGGFYIFSNVNGRKTQLFTANSPAGPWAHQELNIALHDLSVLFDDDGRIYAVWGYRDVEFAELDRNFDIIPGTHRVLFDNDSGMGEGSHFYKIDGKYYITSAWWNGRMRMPCARANSPDGPWEVNPEISADEEFGIPEGNRLIRDRSDDFELSPPNPNARGRMSLHQGGIVQTQNGEWWGFSMMDYNSVGRLTCLSPVTWKNGWPYFGLPGNLGRSPRTWIKPNTGPGSETSPRDPYQRNDDFNGTELANAWQWNHVPINNKWSLEERPGYLRLHAHNAQSFWEARNTLTQRAIGPKSIATTELEMTGMKVGDIAGLALLNHPYAWIGITKTSSGFQIQFYDRKCDETISVPFQPTAASNDPRENKIYLRATCDYLKETADFSFSLDGEHFQSLKTDWMLIYQGRTFQGIRYSLFNFQKGKRKGKGGYADFNNFSISQPYPSGFTKPIPYGRTIQLCNMLDQSLISSDMENVISVPEGHTDNTEFRVVDLGLGRVAFESKDGRRITVTGPSPIDQVKLQPAGENGAANQSFQWMEMPYGQILLMSLKTNRYLRIRPNGGMVTTDARGAKFDHKNGASFDYRLVE